MEGSWIFFVSIAGLLIFIYHAKKLSNPQGARLPPGPPALPIVGHLHLLGILPHLSLQELAKKYGPLMSLRLGSVLTVVVTSPEIAREVLRTQDHIFYQRPKRIRPNIIHKGTQGILFENGEKWRSNRKRLVTEALNITRIKQFEDDRKDEILSAISRLLSMSRGEQVVDIDEVTSVLRMNNIIRFLFGKCAFGENIKNKTAVEEAKKFSELLERLSNARPMIGDSIPFLHILDKANIREVEYMTSELDRILDIVLEEHRLKVGQLQDESGGLC